MTFDAFLHTMSKGTRNLKLVPAMLRGLSEGKTPQDVINCIQAVHNDLTEAELRHAMETSLALKTDRPSVATFKIAQATKAGECATIEERNFVKDTIAKAKSATSKDLMSLSPVAISDAAPREQAMAYCATIFPDDRHMVFTASEETKFKKRTFETLDYPSTLYRRLADGGMIPAYAIANQFTGLPDDWGEATSGGGATDFTFTSQGSFACMKTLATRRIALLEFDALPLADQARFWVAAIENDIFKGRLRTLVYSGSKSIHALLRVDSAETSRLREDDSIDGWVAEYDDDPVAKWKAERGWLSRLTEHGDEEMYRADGACKDPTRLTRFAGAARTGKDGKRRVQRLLWCAGPKECDVPITPGSGQERFLVEGYGLNGDYYKC